LNLAYLSFLEILKLNSIAVTLEKFLHHGLRRAASADRNLRPGEALQRIAADLLPARRVSSDGEVIACHGDSGNAPIPRPGRGLGRRDQLIGLAR
jgi:hypothetical protein